VKLIASALAAVLLTGTASAANITYAVDDYVGTFGHLTGTVVTDGTTGVLSASNFLTWTLNVQGDGATDVLTNLNSGVYINGTSTTATATNILFDFANTLPSYLLFQKNFSSGNSYVCAASTPFPSTPCYQGASLVPQSYTSPSSQYSLPEGNVIVASVAGVPEPAAWALMIGGFGLIGSASRRRKVSVAFN
jgi:hypothetical protein